VRLLDTDVCIAILRGRDDVIERRAAVADEVATTWITAAELHYGAAKSADPPHNRALVTRFLATLPVAGLDAGSVRIFGDTKAVLEKAGRRLADADLFIAAIALSRGAVLITGNRRHYERIEGLAIEDWLRR
jgi:tRNA(fMet)-specific endonuclease VapC